MMLASGGHVVRFWAGQPETRAGTKRCDAADTVCIGPNTKGKASETAENMAWIATIESHLQRLVGVHED